MDAGYCTYFATTMVTMLRTQDIPARFAVGYTPGQQVEDDEWIVRGYDSHAWVEVYVPETGWVRFDPTPSAPRERTERQRLADARESGSEDVDIDASNDSELDRGTPEPRPTATGDPTTNPFRNESRPPGVDRGGETGGDGPGPSPSVPLPDREQAGVGLVVLAGLAAAGRRTGADRRLYRELWLRRLPDDSPEATVVGAFHRVVHLEERAGREREPGETARTFLADSDRRARRVGELYERARYGHGADEADAAEAAAHLSDLLEERSRLPAGVRRPHTGSR